MISITPLIEFTDEDWRRIVTGYTSAGRYRVLWRDDTEKTSFSLEYVPLSPPYVKRYDFPDEDTLGHYRQALKDGFSFGAYEDSSLIGLLIAEPQRWNHSLWVWEFHVAEGFRGQGIGKNLMEQAVSLARSAGLRIVVCETQNTNVPAIRVYRALGFKVEGVDISYYTNQDYPDGEVALFMKRRL